MWLSRKFLAFITLFLVLLGMMIGAMMYRYRVPPVGLGILDLGLFNQGQLPQCLQYEKMTYYDELPKTAAPKLVFFGDSVAEGVYDSRVINARAVDIAFSGLTVRCGLEYLPTIQKMSSDRMIVYLGGNDADNFLSDKPFFFPSPYGEDPIIASKNLAQLYGELLDGLISAGITPIVHGIHHGGAWRRSQPFVRNFNDEIQSQATQRQLLYIPPLEDFSFSNLDDVKATNYSFDGEHIRYQGYLKWRDHIRRYVKDF